MQESPPSGVRFESHPRHRPALFVALSGLRLAGTTLILATLAAQLSDPSQRLLVVPMLVSAAIWLVTELVLWFRIPRMRLPVHRPPTSAWRVAVAVPFVPQRESLEMLERTVRAAVDLHYPHDTWVLDEGDRDEVRALCVRLGVHHFSRRHRPVGDDPDGRLRPGTKHGNFNAWLDTIGYDRYDALLQCDSDHVLQPSYLDRTLGYLEDPAVGYVQVPSAYYNQRASFVARGTAESSYRNWTTGQLAANARGRPLIHGSHCLHRFEALRRMGGFPPFVAEDLAHSFYYRHHGWRGVYVPEVLGRGLAPVDLAAYLAQQLRWMRGGLEVRLKALSSLRSSIRRDARLVCWTHAIGYLLTLSVPVQIVISLARGVTPAVFETPVLARLCLGGLALWAAARYRRRFFFDPASRGSLHWRKALLEPASRMLPLVALVEVALLGRPVRFNVTDKRAGRERHRPWLIAGFHAVLGLVVLAAWLRGNAVGSLSVGLQLWAAVQLATHLVLLAAAWMPSPPAYDERVMDSERTDGLLPTPQPSGTRLL